MPVFESDCWLSHPFGHSHAAIKSFPSVKLVITTGERTRAHPRSRGLGISSRRWRHRRPLGAPTPSRADSARRRPRRVRPTGRCFAAPSLPRVSIMTRRSIFYIATLASRRYFRSTDMTHGCQAAQDSRVKFGAAPDVAPRPRTVGCQLINSSQQSHAPEDPRWRDAPGHGGAPNLRVDLAEPEGNRRPQRGGGGCLLTVGRGAARRAERETEPRRSETVRERERERERERWAAGSCSQTRWTCAWWR